MRIIQTYTLTHRTVLVVVVAVPFTGSDEKKEEIEGL